MRENGGVDLGVFESPNLRKLNSKISFIFKKNGEPNRGARQRRGRAEERLPPQAEVHAPALLRPPRRLGARPGPPGVLREREEVPRKGPRPEEGARAGDLLQHQQARGRQEQAHDRAVHARGELRRGRGERGGPGRVVPGHGGAAVQK